MMNDQRQLEPEIKACTLNHLFKKGVINHNYTIINEFTIDRYSRRVDLVIASDKRLTAIEIKSEADSLIRLQGQTDKYLEYFDKVIIVAAPKHIINIIRTVPKQVAVWEISGDNIKIIQQGKIVPIKNKTRFIDLMTAGELIKLSNQLGMHKCSVSRKSLEQILEKAPLSKLKKAALCNIQERYILTSSFFWNIAKNTKVLPEHIELLSPSRDNRLSQKAILEQIGEIT